MTTKKTTTKKKTASVKEKKTNVEDMTDEQIVNMITEEEPKMPVEIEENETIVDDMPTQITVNDEPIDDGNDVYHLNNAMGIECKSEGEDSTQTKSTIEDKPIEDVPVKENTVIEPEPEILKIKKEEPNQPKPSQKKIRNNTTRGFYGYDHMGMIYDY